MSDELTRDLQGGGDTNPMLERILEEVLANREEMVGMPGEVKSLRAEIDAVRDDLSSLRREVRYGFAAIEKSFDDYSERTNRRVRALEERVAAVEETREP
jgi:hypothetical protein